MVSKLLAQLCVVLTFVGNSFPSTIELFDQFNFKGSISSGPYFSGWEQNPRNCYNFPNMSQKRLSSVKSNGNCVIFYDQKYCSGLSFKIDADVSNIAELQGNGTHDNFDNSAVSLKFCDFNEGGKSFDIELFDETNHKGNALRYAGVCRCTSIPSKMRNVSSLNNHHHCVRLYSSNNCSSNIGEHLDVFAGNSTVSQNLTDQRIYTQVNSFRPCQPNPDCYQLRAELYHITVNEDPDSYLTPRSSKMSMAAKSSFKNNGQAYVSQEYTASRVVSESFLYEKIFLTKRVQKWTTSRQLKKEANLGFIGNIIKIFGGLDDFYSYQCDWSESRTEVDTSQTRDVYFREERTEFYVHQKVQVPPCSMYEVNSTVVMVEDYPFKYSSYIRLQGEFSNQRMTAAELLEELEFMNGYEYNHTVDDYTIAAYTNSIIVGKFGTDTEIIGIGERLPDCY